MKLLLISFFCAAISICNAVGQGKVLIVASDSSEFSEEFPNGLSRIQGAITKSYSGQLETRIGKFPDTLITYDAVFTNLYFYDGDDSLAIAAELEKLTRYLSRGGKLYVQVSFHSTYHYGHGFNYPPYYEYPLFREFVGVTQFNVASSSIFGIKNIQGMPGYFTEGLQYVRKTNPAEMNSHSILFLSGVTEVLKAGDYPIGWQHEKEGAKVVWHWPIVSEHYDEFIGRVVCNYFGLCEPLKGVDVAESSTCRISFDPIGNIINIENASPNATVELYSVLGVKLLSTQVGSGRVKVPHLPRGSYFVVVRENARQIVTTSIMM